MNSTPPQPADASLLCPACGYDLRGSDSGRCPECGLEIDRNALQTSAIPWAHRKSIGRIRAYWRTVWQITLGSRKLAHEAAKPQDPRDGAAFVRVTGVLLAILVLGLSIFIARQTEWFRIPIVIPPDMSSGGAALPRWTLDVGIPWAAGMTLWPVLVACLIAFAFHVASVQRTIFRLPRGADDEQRRRAIALGAYTSAPLVLLIPAFAIFLAGGYAMDSTLDKVSGFRWPIMIFMALGACLIPGLFAITAWRTGRWIMRTRHCGIGSAALAVLELLALWLAGFIILLLVIPWCVGFLWIVFDSFRR